MHDGSNARPAPPHIPTHLTHTHTHNSSYIIERSKWAAAVLFGPGGGGGPAGGGMLSSASVAEYAAQLKGWNTANVERLFAEL